MPPKTYKSFPKLLAIVLTYSIGSFYFGYSMAYFNSIHFKSIYKIFSISMPEEQAEGVLSGCLPFGALLGAYCSSYIIGRFSRRQAFIVVGLVAIVATLMVLTGSTWLLLMGRVLQGFCVGNFSSLVPLMVREFSPLELTGSFGALMAPSIGIGFFFAYLLSYVLKHYYKPKDFWYITFGLPIFIIAAQLFLLMKIFRNETPKYLISHGRIDEARELIQEIYKFEFVEKIFNDKMKDLKGGQATNNYQLSASFQKQPQVQPPISDIKAQAQPEPQLNQEQPQKQPKSALSIPNLYPQNIKIATFFAYFLQTFHQLSGINVIVIFGAHLAKQSVPQLKDEVPLIINGEKILAGLCGTLLLNRFGRRYLMLRGLVVIFLSLVGLAIGFSLDQPNSSSIQTLIIVCLICYASAFVITLGPITWLYIPQIVQPPTVPFTTMLNWFLACIIITLFPMMQAYLKWIFLFFAFIVAANFFMCYFLMVETKGKKEAEVRAQFVRKEEILGAFLGRLRQKFGRGNY